MSTAAPGVQVPSRARFGAGSVLLLVAGALLALIGLALLAGGGAIVWANGTQRDGDGYFTTSSERFATSAYALTHESVDLFDATVNSNWEEELGDLATLRVRVTDAEQPVFLGVGPAVEVERYLSGVDHADVGDVAYDPFHVEYRDVRGGAPAEVPGHEPFWAVTAGGATTETLMWPVEPGTWSLVVMNADGSPGVSADLEFGAKVEHLGRLALGLILGGFFLTAGGGAMIFVGLRRSGGDGTAAGAPQSRTHPA